MSRDYVAAADAAANFILQNLRRETVACFTRGETAPRSSMPISTITPRSANSLVTLYEATVDERWIDEAVRLMDIVLDKFADPAGGGFFYTATDHEQLLTRTKELTDSSTPSGNALAATALLRLGKLLGRADYLDAAEATLEAAAPIMERAPMAAGQMLLALDFHFGPSYELVLVGDSANSEVQAALPTIGRHYLPRTVFAARLSEAGNKSARSSRLDELFAGKSSPMASRSFIVCQNFACQAPAIGSAAIDASCALSSSRYPTPPAMR